jgi:hypothetical protein
MPDTTATIYVALLHEGPDAWRPVQAAPRAGGLFLILSKNDDPESECWQFPSGSLVRCESRRLADRELLLAVEAVAPQGLRLART